MRGGRQRGGRRREAGAGRTSQPPVEPGVGGHLEAGVRQQEAADVGEAGVDVLPDVLQLLVLVGLHLNRRRRQNVGAAQTRRQRKEPDSRAAVSPGSLVLPPGRTGARRGSSSLGSETSASEQNHNHTLSRRPALASSSRRTGADLKGLLADLLHGQASVLGEELRRGSNRTFTFCQNPDGTVRTRTTSETSH